MHWQGRDRATFRWTPSTQRLDLLAKPSESNVKALFDAASEAGLCSPALVITGTPEFKQLAAAEAARRNIPVDDSKDEIVRKYYNLERDRISASRSAEIEAVLMAQAQRDQEREAARQAREQERIKAELERLENEDDRQQHMRMEP